MQALAAAGLDGDSSPSSTPTSSVSDDVDWRSVFAAGATKVDLSCKVLSAADVDDLALALAENNTIEHLLLGSNHIGPDRIACLVPALAVRTTGCCAFFHCRICEQDAI